MPGKQVSDRTACNTEKGCACNTVYKSRHKHRRDILRHSAGDKPYDEKGK